jgi:Tfp pilus assembly protein PilO
MSVEPPERRSSLQSKLLEQLRDPTRLRIALTATVLLVGYGAIYAPLRDRIAATKRNLDEARKQLNLARDVEQLRAHFHDVETRLPRQTDSKEWVQYVLNGIRKLPVTVKSLKCDAPRELGPYKAVVLQIQLSGSFADLDQFLYWLELNKRFFRTDEVSITTGNDKDKSILVMKLTVLGMMG